MDPMTAAEHLAKCAACGSPIGPTARFCPNCGKPLAAPAATKPVAAAPEAPRPVPAPPLKKHVKKKQMTAKERAMSLVPVIVALLVGLAVGTANGTAGMIVSIIVGLLLSVFLVKRMSPQAAIDSLKLNITKTPFILKLVYIIGVIMLMALFSVTVNKSGLELPSGHNPNTYSKYLSIIVVIPNNMMNNILISAFPGLPVITVPALLIIAIGAMIPERFLARKWKPIIILVGLILLTVAPYITHAVLNMKNKVLLDYTPEFYVVWVGFVLVAIDAWLPLIMKSAKVSPGGKGPIVAGMVMPVILPIVWLAFLFPPILAQTGGGPNFEANHHMWAGVISGVMGGFAGASVVDDTTSTSEDVPTEYSDEGGTDTGPSTVESSSDGGFGGDAPGAGTKIPFITGGLAPWAQTPPSGTMAGFAVPTDTPPVKVSHPTPKTEVGGTHTGMGTTTGTSTGTGIDDNTGPPVVPYTVPDSTGTNMGTNTGTTTGALLPPVGTTGPSTGTGQGHETGTDTVPPLPPIPIPPYWQLPGPLQMTPPDQPPTEQPLAAGSWNITQPVPKAPIQGQPPPFLPLTPQLQMTPPVQPPPVQKVVDDSWHIGEKYDNDSTLEDKEFVDNVTKETLDVGTSVAPYVHAVRDGQEVLTGQDIFEGKEMTSIGWAISLAGLLNPEVPGGGHTYRKYLEVGTQKVGEKVFPSVFYIEPGQVEKMGFFTKMFWRSPPQNLKAIGDWMGITSGKPYNQPNYRSPGGRFVGP